MRPTSMPSEIPSFMPSPKPSERVTLNPTNYPMMPTGYAQPFSGSSLKGFAKESDSYFESSSESTNVPAIITAGNSRPIRSPATSGAPSFGIPELPTQFPSGGQWAHLDGIGSDNNNGNNVKGHSSRESGSGIDVLKTIVVPCGAIAFLSIAAAILLVSKRRKKINSNLSSRDAQDPSQSYTQSSSLGSSLVATEASREAIL